jgi:predicted nuclease with TOPRIM domain
MGEIMLKYFKYVGDEVGVEGRMKLSQLTKTNSIRAATAEDTVKTIDVFKKAVQEITGNKAPEF